MDFEEGDTVLLRDKHSDHDGEVGEITQVAETMFGDATFTVSFDEGQEAGLSADSLDSVETGAADDGEPAEDATGTDDGTRTETRDE